MPINIQFAKLFFICYNYLIGEFMVIDIDFNNDETKLVYIEIVQEFIKNKENNESDFDAI